MSHETSTALEKAAAINANCYCAVPLHETAPKPIGWTERFECFLAGAKVSTEEKDKRIRELERERDEWKKSAQTEMWKENLNIHKLLEVAEVASVEEYLEKIPKLLASQNDKIDILCSLYDTPLSVYGGVNATDFIAKHGTEYARATIRRMGYHNPLEQENEQLKRDMNRLIDAAHDWCRDTEEESSHHPEWKALSGVLQELMPEPKEKA